MAILVWIRVCVWCIYFTCLYMHGLMPCMFFTFVHMAHMHVLFKLWVICTVCTEVQYP